MLKIKNVINNVVHSCECIHCIFIIHVSSGAKLKEKH